MRQQSEALSIGPWRGVFPPLSGPNTTTLAVDAAGEIFASENGGPYVALASIISGGGWTDDGAVVRLTTVTDAVSIGEAVPPAGVKLNVSFDPPIAGSVIEAEYIGQEVAGAGTDAGAGMRVRRVRSAASADFWYSCFAANPVSFAGDVGVEVAFHAEPLTSVPASGAVAFQLEATPGAGFEYSVALQAYEQPCLIRSIRLVAGFGYPTTIRAADGVGVGNDGGDVIIEPGADGGGGDTGRVLIRPASGDTASGGDLLQIQTVAGTFRLAVGPTGALRLGSTTSPGVDATALLQLESTTQGLLLPRMTTAQRDAIAAPTSGLLIYNTTTGKANVRGAAAWEAITSV
jgi:hypothetical protein